MSQQTNTQTFAQTIQVVKPAAGESASFESQGGARLVFDFDPATATVSRTGNDLVFQLDDGGSVTLSRFFEVGDQPLPSLVLPAGDEVASAEFLSAFDVNLETAAGPGAGASSGSGGAGEYSDDPGALVDGISRLGSLGTIYWDQETEIPEAYSGIEAASFTFSLSFRTDVPSWEQSDEGWISGTFRNLLFEDGQPNQHLPGGRDSVLAAKILEAKYGIDIPAELENKVPGVLEFTFDPSGTTQLTSLTLTGFAPGSTVMVGDMVVPITSATQQIFLTPDQVAGFVGVYPPENNSDRDMPITATIVGTTASGTSTTQILTVTLIVDAVADLASGEAGMKIEEQWFAEDLNRLEEKVYDSSEARDVTFNVGVTFTDWEDGSEFQSIEVAGVPADWTLNMTGLAETLALVGAAPYATLDEAREALLAEGAGTYAMVAGKDGTVTYIFNVTGEETVSGNISFNPHDWTTFRDADGDLHNPFTDGTADISITARTEEVKFSGGELSEDLAPNNVSETTVGDFTVTIKEDTPDICTNFIKITSDETRGIQCHTDETYLSHGIKKALANLDKSSDDLDLPKTGSIVSIAQQSVRYDLHSDGSNDGYHFDSDRNAGKADISLSFLGKEGRYSGWQTTGGDKIYLFEGPDGSVIGSTNPDGFAGDPESIAFLVMVNGSLHNGLNSGSITFVQYQSLEHPKGGEEHNEEMSVPFFGKDIPLDLGLILTVTDDDGDKAITAITINVHDDGPYLCLKGNGPTVMDETDLTGHCSPGHIEASGKYAFNPGADEHGATIGLDPNALPDLKVNGQDVQYSFEYAADGKTVIKIIGTVDVDGDGNGPTINVLEVSLDAANSTYTYKQFVGIDHTDENDHDEVTTDDGRMINFGLVGTDGDGDTVTQQMGFTVHDDGPGKAVCLPKDCVWEGDLRQHDSLIAEGKLPIDFGADNHNPGIGAGHNGAAVFWNEENVAKELGALDFIRENALIENTDVTFDIVDGNHVAYVYAEGESSNPLLTVTLIDNGNGEYSYKYEQFAAIEHAERGLGDYLDKLSLDYIVKDSDGDTVGGSIGITVWDSTTLPSLQLEYVDESNYDKTTGVLTHNFELMNLDYEGPDGVAFVGWDANATSAALNLLGYGNLESTVNGNVLTLYQNSEPFATLTLVESAKYPGQFAIEYKQEAPLDHPIGGWFAPNDLLSLPVVVTSTSHDHDSASNLVSIIVADDAPKGFLVSNVDIIGNLGQAVIGALSPLVHDTEALLDIFKSDNILEGMQAYLGDAFTELGEGLVAGITDVNALVDLVDLLGNTNLPVSLEAFWDNLDGLSLSVNDLLAIGQALLSGDYSQIPANIMAHILGTDSDRTEGPGQVYEVSYTPDFGFDGPADQDPVIWNAKGVEAMLKLIGATSSTDHTALAVQVDPGHPGFLQIVSGATPAVPVLTLEITKDVANPGTFVFSVTQQSGLVHNPNILDALLGQIGDLAGLSGDALADALAGLAGSGLDTEALGFLFNLFGDQLGGMLSNMATALSGGNLMSLNFPVILTDGDGDHAGGVVNIVIRDAVPVDGQTTRTTLDDDDYGLDGQGTLFATGDLKIDFGFDGPAPADTFAWIAPENSGLKVLIGGEYKEVVFESHGATLLGTVDGETVVTLTFDVETKKYTVESKYPVFHEDGIDTREFDFGYTFKDSDGDTASGKLVVEVLDSVNDARDNTDSLDPHPVTDYGKPWTAEGNVVTSKSTAEETAGPHDQPSVEDAFVGFAGGAVIEGNQAGIEPFGTFTHYVEGDYGTLYYDAKGNYHYELTEQAEPISIIKPETEPLKSAVVNEDGSIADTPFIVKAYQYDSANGFNLPNGNNVAEWATGVEETVLSADGKGLGSAGSTKSFADGNYLTYENNANDGDQLGNSEHTFVLTGSWRERSAEALVVTIDDAQPGSVSVTIGELTSLLEGATVYFYDADTGALLGKVDATASLFATSDAVTFGDANTTIGSIVVLPKAGTSCTVTEITYPKEEVTLQEDKFNYTLTDADKDVDTATLTITLDTRPVAEPDGPIPDDPNDPDYPGQPEVVSRHLTVDEADMAAGSVKAGAADDYPQYDTTATGTLNFTSENGVKEVSFGGTAIAFDTSDPANGPWTGDLGGVTIGAGANGEITGATLSFDPDTGVYTLTYDYMLTTARTVDDSNDGRDADQLSGAFNIVIMDLDGDPSDAIPITVTIIDDVPVLTVADNDNDATGTVEAFVGTWAPLFGADGEGSVQVSFEKGAFVSLTKDSSSGNYTYDDGEDKIVLYADGRVGFTSGTDASRTGLIIDIKIVDGDGDSATDRITFDTHQTLGATVAGAAVYESDIDSGIYQNAYNVRPGTDGKDDMPGTEGHVQDNNLDGVETGDESTISGTLAITGVPTSLTWDSTNLPTGIQARIGDTWQDVKWSVNGLVISGYVGSSAENGTPVVTVTATKNGDGYDYEVTIDAALKHVSPGTNGTDGNNSDSSYLDFGFTVSDANENSASASLKVQVVDDVPEVPTIGTVTVNATNGELIAEDISLDFNGYNRTFNGGSSETGDGADHDYLKEIDGKIHVLHGETGPDRGTDTGITIVGKAVNGDVIDIEVFTFNDKANYPGLGINAKGDDDSEIGEDGKGNGESILFQLPAGQIAYGLHLDLAHFYSNDSEIERCQVEFYRDGKVVYTLDLTAESADGTKIGGKDYLTGAYDSVLIRPLTLAPNGPNRNENSDFNIEAIQFNKVFTVSEVIADASGTIAANFGADGPDTTPYVLGIPSGGEIYGAKVTWSEPTDVDNNGIWIIEGTIGDRVVAEVHFQVVDQGNAASSPKLGWALYQFEAFDDGAETVTINYSAVDADGDSVTGTVVVDLLDELEANQASDAVLGTSGDDTINGGAGDDVIYGGAGDDVINGGSGNDLIYGGAGDDILFGGACNDTMYGGTGADTFAWHASDYDGGYDKIMDFNMDDGDKLRFSDILVGGETLDDVLGTGIVGNIVDNHLEISIDMAGVTQTVEVNFDGAVSLTSQSYDSFADFTSDYNNADSAAQQAMMTELIKNMAG